MSENQNKNTQTEEVDLGQLFTAIGNVFRNLFNGLKSLFIWLFRTIIFALKPIVNNIKTISIVVIISTILGFAADKFKNDVYVSDMLVKPYFESKYQLVNNIDYFNSLINSENYTELSRVFSIDTSQSKNLLQFDLKLGPETKNDLLIDYNEYLTEVDTTLADVVSFDDFIENRDLLEGNKFLIIAKAKSQDVFKNLEKGFKNTFENEYSIKQKERRDSILLSKKATFIAEVEKINKIQETYLKIKTEESKNPINNLSSGNLIPLLKEKAETKEYELFEQELRIRERIRVINEELIEEGDYYDVLSGFEVVGKEETELIERYLVLFPLLAFGFMVVSFLLFNVFKFIKNYE